MKPDEKSDWMQVFVDSNIFLDYYLDRKNHVKPLGEFAFQFFKEAVACKYHVIISGEVVFEIKTILKCSEEFISEVILKQLIDAKKLKLIESTSSQLIEAARLNKELGVPRNDALYAILARDNAAMLLTRDNHFDALKHIIEALTPEELQQMF